MIAEDGPEYFSAEYRQLSAAIEEHGETPCMSAPDLFFSDEEKDWGQKMTDTYAAKRLCSGCPVKLECLQYALAAPERDGVWGGLSTGERKTLLRKVVA
jgi:WhiB family redox-sensing transcriptional regulator